VEEIAHLTGTTVSNVWARLMPRAQEVPPAVPAATKEAVGVSEPRVFTLDDEEAALVGNVLPPVRPEPVRLEAIFQRLIAGRPPPRRTGRSRLVVVGAVLLFSGARRGRQAADGSGVPDLAGLVEGAGGAVIDHESGDFPVLRPPEVEEHAIPDLPRRRRARLEQHAHGGDVAVAGGERQGR
jgi:hypothetical protein